MKTFLAVSIEKSGDEQVQFGLARPEVKYTGHTDNEFKTAEQFLPDLQIVTEMMARIGQLPKL